MARPVASATLEGLLTYFSIQLISIYAVNGLKVKYGWIFRITSVSLKNETCAILK